MDGKVVLSDLSDSYDNNMDKSFKKEWVNKYMLLARYLIREIAREWPICNPVHLSTVTHA